MFPTYGDSGVVYNPYIVTPLVTWAVAQVLKFAIAAFRGRIDFKYLYASGGMPSVHSAIVVSLATTSLLLDGAGSHLFGLTAVVAAIVIYDSLGVRRAAGDQAVALNLLMAESSKGKAVMKPLREVLGHTPGEVLAGAGLGLVLGGVFAYDKLGFLGDFITAIPSKTEFHTYAVIGLVLFVLSLVVRLGVPSLRKDSQAVRHVAKSVFSTLIVSGVLLMLAALLTYEQASYLAWRLWAILVLGITGVVLIRQSIGWVLHLPEQLAAEAEAKRKSKWFNWGRGRRKAKKA